MKNIFEIPIAIFWFRRDLRLDDNHGLYKALSSGLQVLPIFIFDTNILSQLSNVEDRRISFIYDTIFKMNENLRLLGYGIKVFNGKPLDIMKYLLSEFSVKMVFTNHDYEPYALQRDIEIAKFLSSQSVDFVSFKDQVIFEKDEILKSDGNPYSMFTPYSLKWKTKLEESPMDEFPSENLLDRMLKWDLEDAITLDNIGFKHAKYGPNNFSTQNLSKYELERNFPALDSTSQMGAHIRFGRISIRKCVKYAYQYSLVWLNQLIWREFFMQVLYFHPHVIDQSFKPIFRNIQWLQNESDFEKWKMGETGFHLVDAGMKELNATGFMHNRVRMVTASFLSKHLLLDWRLGENYFAELLMDFELASNNGNWQWVVGCGCDAAPFFRIFNPILQQKMFDKEEKYIKKWLGNDLSKRPKPMVDHEFARKRALHHFKSFGL